METLGRAMGSRSFVIGGCLLLIVMAMAAFAGLVFPDDPLDMVGAPLQKPVVSMAGVLGTDSTGRSVAAQLMYGARTSLLIGFIATGVAVLTGVLVGALAGFYGGWVDTLLMRVTEAFQIVPSFILLLVLVVVFGSDIQTLAFVIGAVSWTAPARLTRAEFLSLRGREFVQACRGLGMSDFSIIFREILPNALPPV